ncbi:hypothetical protein CDD82_7327 [Ophiocordyceps australis]|uniref:BTB domain-containing protein n=1 Tax=Ophiocordyceps australis TaxID=1399860 RepID=A0A2C5ZQB5_9HYPO|nr:hypothetical protein CDD82_7327 [Ophiocordyceps australis]
MDHAMHHVPLTPLLFTDEADNASFPPSCSGPLHSPCSVSPTSSREIFQAAAPRAAQSLWHHPFGADVLVHCLGKALRVHRSIVAPQVGWLRDNLPPPNKDGTAVDAVFPGSDMMFSHSLRFMYTNSIDICEPDDTRPHDICYVARSALFYAFAVDIRSHTIAAYLLATLDSCSERWKGYVDEYFHNGGLSSGDCCMFAFHMANAFSVAYGHPRSDLIAPLRLALAGLLDVVLPLMVQQPPVIDLLSSSTWRRYSTAVTRDLDCHRRRRSELCSLQSQNKTMPRHETMRLVFEKAWDANPWMPMTWLDKAQEK